MSAAAAMRLTHSTGRWLGHTGHGPVTARQRSLARTWTLALSSHSTHGARYVAAVRTDRLPGPLLHDSQIGELRRAREPVGQHRPEDFTVVHASGCESPFLSAVRS
jgi:hypothetical protein